MTGWKEPTADCLFKCHRIFKLSHIFGIIDHPAYRGQNEHTSKIIIVHLIAPGVRIVTQRYIKTLLALGFFFWDLLTIRQNRISSQEAGHEMRHHHHHQHHRHLGVTCTQGTCVLNPRHKMWSCMVDTDTPRSVRAWRAQRRVPREKPGLPCRWPQLWHIGIRSVLLWVTLPRAGPRKTLQLWWTTATHSRSLMLSRSHTHTHTHTHKHRQTSSRSLWTYIFICEFRGKTNCHQKATYGPLLMEHLSWALTDTVTRIGPVAWMFFCAAVLSFIRQLYQDSLLHNFQLHRCLFFFRRWCGACLCQVWIPRTIGKDEFSSIANHKTPFLFMHVGRRTTNSSLSVTLEECIFFPLEWERGGDKKVTFRRNKNTLHWGEILDSDKQQNTHQNNSRLAAKHGSGIKWKREE